MLDHWCVDLNFWRAIRYYFSSFQSWSINLIIIGHLRTSQLCQLVVLGVQLVASLFLFRHLVHMNPQVTCSNGWDVAVETFQEVFWPTTHFSIPHFLSVPYWRHHRRTELVFYTIPNDPLTIVDQRIRVSEQAISNGTHQQSKIYCPDIPIEPLCQPNSNLVRSTYLESPLREYFHD